MLLIHIPCFVPLCRAAGAVHPDQSEVFVLGTEPIQCQDGVEKNDCERNSKKRLLNWLSSVYKEEKFLFLEDALYFTLLPRI